MADRFTGTGNFYKAIEIAVQATGASGVRDLEQAVQDIQRKIDLTKGSMAAFSAAGTNSAKVTQQQVRDLEELSAQLAVAIERFKAAEKVMGGYSYVANQTSESTKRMGYALMNVSYAVQDAQYGIGAVVNNIGLLSQALGNAFPSLNKMTESIGGVAGLGAGVMFAGVAFDILYHNWDKVAGLFGQGHVKTQAEEMKELGNQTHRTADQEERLLKLKERAKNLDEQGKGPGGVSDFKSDVNKAIAEAGVPDVDKGIDKYFGNRIEATISQQPEVIEARKNLAIAQEQRAKAIAMGQDPSAPGMYGISRNDAVNTYQNTINQAYGQAREAFRADLPSKPGTVAQLAAFAAASPRDFGKNGRQFATSLAAASPEAKQQAAIQGFWDDMAKDAHQEMQKSEAQVLADEKEQYEASDKQEADRLHREQRAERERAANDKNINKGFDADARAGNAANKAADRAMQKQGQDLIKQMKERADAADPNKQLAAEKAHLRTLALFGDTVQIQAEAAMRLDLIERQQRAILGGQRRIRGGRRPKQVQR